MTIEERDMFLLLLGVTGVGAKAALSVLSVFTASQIILSVATDDYDTLSKAPGVGKKTAQRIALELKDKVKAISREAGQAVDPQQMISLDNNERQDAITALISLGYAKNEAVKAVLEVSAEGLDAEDIIKAALRKLSKY